MRAPLQNEITGTGPRIESEKVMTRRFILTAIPGLLRSPEWHFSDRYTRIGIKT
jgi:hypothetical protein